jgi:hypothetical protein
MSYRLRLNVRNRASQPRKVIIYGGTVFEVDDPHSRVQNLVATQNTVVTIAAHQSQSIEIDTWCLNRSFAPPNQTPMRPTVLATSHTYGNQQDLWNDMNERR